MKAAGLTGVQRGEAGKFMTVVWTGYISFTALKQKRKRGEKKEHFHKFFNALSGILSSYWFSTELG